MEGREDGVVMSIVIVSVVVDVVFVVVIVLVMSCDVHGLSVRCQLACLLRLSANIFKHDGIYTTCSNTASSTHGRLQPRVGLRLPRAMGSPDIGLQFIRGAQTMKNQSKPTCCIWVAEGSLSETVSMGKPPCMRKEDCKVLEHGFFHELAQLRCGEREVSIAHAVFSMSADV